MKNFPLVKVTTATTSTTDITFGPRAGTSFFTPSEAGAVDGDKVVYVLTEGGNLEYGWGVIGGSVTTLTRNVLKSIISGTVGTTKLGLFGGATLGFVTGVEALGLATGSRAVTAATDTIGNTDRGQAIVFNRSSAIAVSIAEAGASNQFLDGWSCIFRNSNTGTATITPTTSTINGAASFDVRSTEGAILWSNGSNYHAVRINSQKMLRVDVAQSFSASEQEQGRANLYAAPFDALARNNLASNGGMTVSQIRGTTALTGVTSNYGGPDQWFVHRVATTVFTLEQSTDAPPGFTHSLKVTVTTADNSLASTDANVIGTDIEGISAARLGWGASGASTISIGFFVKSNVTGTFTLSVRNSATNRSYMRQIAINAANTWEFKTTTIPGDTSGTWLKDTGIGIAVRFSLGCGSNFQGTANQWNAAQNLAVSGDTNFVATTSNTFQIAGFAMLPGNELMIEARAPLMHVPFDEALRQCQRYTFKSYSYPDALGTVTQNGTMVAINFFGSTFLGLHLTDFPVEMRVPPTLTWYNPVTGGTGSWRDGGGSNRTMALYYQPSTRHCTGYTSNSDIGAAFAVSGFIFADSRFTIAL